MTLTTKHQRLAALRPLSPLEDTRPKT
jgi:hypothetical protein